MLGLDFFDQIERRAHPWPAGRADLHWHLLPPVDVAEQLAAVYRAAVDRPGMARVDPEWMHITVQHGGPMDDYRDGEIDAVVHEVAARAADMAPVEIVLDRPALGAVALECAGRPGAVTRPVWEMVTAAHAAVTGGRFPVMPAVHYPHATIAYVAGPQVLDRAAVKAIVSDVPGEPVTVRLDRLTAVAQWHDRRHITWRPVAEVPLGEG